MPFDPFADDVRRLNLSQEPVPANDNQRDEELPKTSPRTEPMIKRSKR